MTGARGPVPHFPRISAADRADGSVDVLIQGESKVFRPAPERGADYARLRSLRFLHEIASDLGRAVRVTTWTIDRARASIVVTPAGECYDEAHPDRSFAIVSFADSPLELTTTEVPVTASTAAPVAAAVASASPSPDIPVAIRGQDLLPAPIEIPSPRGSRTGWVIAGVLGMLLLWSGVVAVVLTTGHNAPAAADSTLTSPASTPPSTAPPSTTPTPAAPVAITSAPPAPAPAPIIAVTSVAPGKLQVFVARSGATVDHPLEVRVRIDPATGATIRRTVRISTPTARMNVPEVPAGRAEWTVLVPGAQVAKGTATVAALPGAVASPTTTATSTPSTTDSTPPTTPPATTPPAVNPPSSHHHHHNGGGTGSGTSSSGGGHDGGTTTQPTHHNGGSPPPPDPVDPDDPNLPPHPQGS